MNDLRDIIPIGHCSMCNDTRKKIVRDDMMGEYKRDCDCVMNYRKGLKLIKESKIPDNYIHFTWNDYYPKVGKEKEKENKKAVKELNDWINDQEYMRKNNGDLLIIGGKASGKTLLACIVLKEIMEKYAYSGLYVTAEELILNTVAQQSFNPNEEVEDLFRNMTRCDYLIIDGFHLLNEQDISKMSLFRIRNMLKRRKHYRRCCILTSNIPFKDLSKSSTFVSEMVYSLTKVRLYGDYSLDSWKKFKEGKNGVSKKK